MADTPREPQFTLDVGQYLKLIALAALIAVAVTLVTGMMFHSIRLLALAAGVEMDRFEDMPLWLRMTLPVLGFVVLMTLMRVFRVEGRDVGAPHALNRMLNYGGEMPWRNAVMQFTSAIVALASGFSGGRDGPGMHLGAWVASLVRSRVRVTRTEADLLLRAGMTAAIAAGFNTTFAAVFFVAAVIRTEPLSPRGVVPLVGAAGVASVLSTWLSIDQVTIAERMHDALGAIEWLCVLGLAVPILCVGVATMRLVIDFTRIRGPLYARIMVIALITAVLAAFLPEVLGLGYDTLETLAQSARNHDLLWLVAFVLIKMLLTSASVAFGVPLGVIAPTIVNGGVLGALCYVALSMMFPDAIQAHISLYVVFGATALLGTVFNAPFAAIVLFLELTMNLVVTAQVAIAILLAHECKVKIWGAQSIFESRLAAQGITLSYRQEGLP